MIDADGPNTNTACLHFFCLHQCHCETSASKAVQVFSDSQPHTGFTELINVSTGVGGVHLDQEDAGREYGLLQLLCSGYDPQFNRLMIESL